MNAKYYAFLMVGIFLAIGLGMMIGMTLEDKNIVENQQTQMIQQIEDHFTHLRTETEQLQESMSSMEEQNDQLYELSSTLMTEVVRNKLSGVEVGVISFAGEKQKKDVGELCDFLQQTGATVQSTIVSFPSSDRDRTASAGKSSDEDPTISAVIESLVFSMRFGGVSPLLQEAEDLKLISHNGGYDVPIDKILLIGQGSSGMVCDRLLIQHASKAGIPVIAVEVGNRKDSGIGEYKKLGVSSVDHGDTIYGKLAVTSLLAGNQGNFGYGAESQMQLPSPLFPETDNDSVATNREKAQ